MLARHAAMVAELETGEVVVTGAAGTARFFATTGGVLRVERDGVAVLADAAEEADEIDIERATSALERAQERIREPRRTPDLDLLRAQLALARALNRLKVASHGKR